MESALTKACTIKIQNFEGPFDLLFHLIEKNKINIYDIPINEITDQYMDYLFKMQELDMEVASEFLVMAATLLHIKSRLLLPNPRQDEKEEIDPREELVLKLVEYKRYKRFTEILKQREQEGEKYFYRGPEEIDIRHVDEPVELSYDEIKRVYLELVERNEKKMNKNTDHMTQILQTEKVSLRSKIREVVKTLLKRSFFRFSELFSPKTKSRLEIVTGFLAVLELTKLKKITIAQQKPFSEIMVYKRDDTNLEDIDENKIAAENS
ncbi:MAG TPA: segregation/condensation protein A [Acetivibrio sp.]|nr:segregation/condensation protein A [Clostridium sp.]HOQ38095.1 segregation/condensation protein A [Acetivibrio sp.]HPT91164.1 segregation/condensation protein A [Acetivibrio sp.]HQA58663.1 segregation/condensation protein A [Acetivibrio sp.]